ncbi:NAD(+)/NADH kinase [Eubacterium sp.]|uniref:NAD(+)/NADH kinase n=1 Tax=Eubacterium sp. TaxID=142586 RepID=UPI0025B926C9|nr:NAD(+)/NADH kinase [Eubacterium sp.]MCI7801409.1 NAD(+)/NADH kinase [Eubacterium sp.]
MKISIFPNFNNDGVLQTCEEICKELDKLGVEYSVAKCNESDETGTLPLFFDTNELIENCDIVIVVGGDGTTLNVAKAASLHNKLTLGINAGRLGFMSGLERDELSLLNRLVSGDYEVEERMMINARLMSENGIQNFICLNDAVITRGDLARLIDVTVKSDGRVITKNRADGMIIATPTGSTAYSMAAGGPVVSPDNSCFVVTPICPHSLVNRSIVFSSDKELEITVENDKNNTSYLSIDGEKSVTVTKNSKIIISKSEYVAKLIKIKPDSFYEILNKKLLERRN